MPAAELHDERNGIQVATSASLALLAISVRRAAAMPADTLRAAVADAYDALLMVTRALGRRPIRFWNYLPNPGQVMGPGVDRYMVFNAGRFDGYQRRAATTAGDFRESLATASAVGFAGSDLVIHCLASHTAGAPVENPRQTSSWRYSSRYGPVPPCFARATVATVRGRELLLVGGTASIVGEDSRHDGDIDAQLKETLRNVAAVIAAAQRADRADAAPLATLTDVRAYVMRPSDVGMVRGVLERVCAPGARLEIMLSRLCRGELLVEVEGVAALSSPA